MPVNPPLLAVALVFHSRPGFDGLDHVITAVSAYADSSVEQPLHKACEFGSVALLERIWNTTVDLEPGGWGLWSVRNLLRSQELYGKLEFSLCLLEAAKLNSVDIARWFLERFPYDVRRKVICEAAKAGALEILQFLRANRTVTPNEHDEQGEEREDWEIRYGGLSSVRGALAKHAQWMYVVFNETAETSSDSSSINSAISGNVELAHWVMNQVGMTRECQEMLHGAAANGNVEVLQWFQDNGRYTTWDTGTLVKAAEAGKLEVVKWIIDRDRQDDTLGYESDADEDDIPRRTYITRLGGEARLSIHVAAINGHLEVAKYLHANVDKPHNKAGSETEMRRLSHMIHELWCFFRPSAYHNDVIKDLSGETMLLAAERGFLDVVKWLYTEYHADPAVNLFWVQGKVDIYGYSDHPSDHFCSVIDAAAAKGHLAIAQYLLRVGGNAEDEQVRKRQRTETYPDQIDRYKVPGCTTVAMNTAAANGHLEVVQWLHANCSEGCTTAAMDLAAENGHLETVKWLHTNRGEGCTTGAMNGAASNGHLHVVKWLHENRGEGCTTYAMDRAAGQGHFEMLKWLHENRTEGCTAAAMDDAAARGRLNIIKWLHSHGAKCTTTAMHYAAYGNHLRSLQWLFENRTEGFTGNAGMPCVSFESVLIFHSIAQQGLAKEVEVMDARQSHVCIYGYYQQCTNLLLPQLST